MLQQSVKFGTLVMLSDDPRDTAAALVEELRGMLGDEHANAVQTIVDRLEAAERRLQLHLGDASDN